MFQKNWSNKWLAAFIFLISYLTITNPYDGYLPPTYHIVIHKAYEDFAYNFTAFVDAKGKLIFRASGQSIMGEYVKSTIATMKAITHGYLKHYLDIKPGTTLGIMHTSVVL